MAGPLDCERLFDEWIEQKETGERRDFEQLCAAHPECEGSFRAALSRLESVQGALKRLAAGEVEETTTGVDSESWKDFLDLLRQLGPTPLRYPRGETLDEGGMGTIVNVSDPLLKRRLVIKLLRDGDPSVGGGTPRTDDRSLGRFLEEAQVTARLDHPYIVPVHDIGIDESGRVFFAMKRVLGDDLRTIFSKIAAGAENWTSTRGVQVILKVCEAMAYAHAKNVIHRDLKPGNVMVGQYGEVYVMDWGIARILDQQDIKDIRIRPDSSESVIRSERKERHFAKADTPDAPLVTMDGDVVGTPAYMPLEQAEGNLPAIGPRSDVYAVGAMLYHLLAGTPPYVERDERVAGRVIWERVKAHLPRSLHEHAPQASAELVSIVEKAMARETKNRYPSMAELAADLQAYLDVRVVRAYETGAIAELKKWVRRNKPLAAAAAALVLVLASAIVIVSTKNADLSNANTEIRNQKAAVETKRVEAESRKAEFDQLAGVVLLERAIERATELVPPWPDKVPEIENWLADDARKIHDLLPLIQQTISDLHARALPRTAEERERERTTHPRYFELQRQQTIRSRFYRVSSSRATNHDRGQNESLPQDLHSAFDLDAFAMRRTHYCESPRCRVDSVVGEERVALAAAEAAVLRIESGDESQRLSWSLDTLAWALFFNGRDEDARDTLNRAVDVASADERDDYQASLKDLETAIETFSKDKENEAISSIEAEIARLDHEVDEQRNFRFEYESDTFLHTTLTQLASDIDEFESSTRIEVEKQLSWAKQIEKLTLQHPNARVTWEEARAAVFSADGITASRLYAEPLANRIELQPQIGLVPIGMNPVTKLWEFYDLRSACDFGAGDDPSRIGIPSHRPDGSIDVTANTGIIFVLIPGGTFTQGAQASDFLGPNFDPLADDDESVEGDLTLVSLSPFLIARHEVTQAQWIRLAGSNPSGIPAADPDFPGLTRPVDSVRWNACNSLFGRYGFVMPTEAQWEYASRAGGSWPFGDEATAFTLAKYGNLRDRSYDLGADSFDDAPCEDWDDGQFLPCEVGKYLANGFGLFDIHGNVWEWCEDDHCSYSVQPQLSNGLRERPNAAGGVIRGGSFQDTASRARCSSRGFNPFDHFSNYVGVRAARDLLP